MPKLKRCKICKRIGIYINRRGHCRSCAANLRIKYNKYVKKKCN